MKTFKHYSVALFVLGVFSQKDAFAAFCSDSCVDSATQACAHLLVRDDASSAWSEVCASPLDSSGGFSFSSPDGSLKEELKKHPEVSIATSGGEGLGLRPRKKKLAPEEIEQPASEVAVDFKSTVEAVDQAQVTDFLIAKSKVLEVSLEQIKDGISRRQKLEVLGLQEELFLQSVVNQAQQKIDSLRKLAEDPRSNLDQLKLVMDEHYQEVDQFLAGEGEDEIYLKQRDVVSRLVEVLPDEGKVRISELYFMVASQNGVVALDRLLREMLEMGEAAGVEVSWVYKYHRSNMDEEIQRTEKAGIETRFSNFSPEFKNQISELVYALASSVVQAESSRILVGRAREIYTEACPDGSESDFMYEGACGYKISALLLENWSQRPRVPDEDEALVNLKAQDIFRVLFKGVVLGEPSDDLALIDQKRDAEKWVQEFRNNYPEQDLSKLQVLYNEAVLVAAKEFANDERSSALRKKIGFSLYEAQKSFLENTDVSRNYREEAMEAQLSRSELWKNHLERVISERGDDSLYQMFHALPLPEMPK